jgi:hypothetical protein
MKLSTGVSRLSHYVLVALAISTVYSTYLSQAIRSHRRTQILINMILLSHLDVNIVTTSRFGWRGIPPMSTRLVSGEPSFDSATLQFSNKQPSLTTYREYSPQSEGTPERIFFTHPSGRSFLTSITMSSAVCFSKSVKTAGTRTTSCFHRRFQNLSDSKRLLLPPLYRITSYAC